MYKNVLNTSSDNNLVKDTLKVIPAPYRYVRTVSLGNRATKLTFGGGSLELDNKGKTICTASYGCVRCGAFGTIGEFGLQCVEQDPAPIQKVYHRFFTFLCPHKPRYVTF